MADWQRLSRHTRDEGAGGEHVAADAAWLALDLGLHSTGALHAAVIPAATAGASGTNLLTETFTNATTTNSGWQMPTGSEGVCLTAGTNTSVTPVPDCDGTSPDAFRSWTGVSWISGSLARCWRWGRAGMST